jgi:long-chain acyl-CoA synthetase
LIVATDDAITAKEVLEYCRARLSLVKCPRSVDFVGDVGRNAMGKVNKRSLRDDYLRAALPSSGRAVASQGPAR